MKKLVIAFLLVIMTVFACSCDDTIRNIGNTSNDYYSYKMLWTPGGQNFGGLAILQGDDKSSDFVKFDDEASYYNKYVYEWFLACGTAKMLRFYYGTNTYTNKETINNYLNTIHCMPDCLEKYGVVDSEIKEILLGSYYNSQDIKLYEPTRRYGSWKYPCDNGWPGYDYIVLFRIKDGQFEGVPGGTLGIDGNYNYYNY